MLDSLVKIASQWLLYPKRFIEGRFKKSNRTLEMLKNDEGAVIDLQGKKVAVYKSKGSKLTTLSPVCKHLGCIVDWNQTDKSWDCPCHGARYKADGIVFKGPSKKNLDKIQLTDK